MDNNENAGFFDKYNKYTLGNIGFAQSLCYFQSTYISNEQQIRCKKGTLSAIKYRGAYSGEKNKLLKIDENAKKAQPMGHDFCGDPSLLREESDCSSYVDFKMLETDYTTNCLGQNDCRLNLQSYLKSESGEKTEGELLSHSHE